MMKKTLLVLLAVALAGCASSSHLPMTYEGKPRVPINKPATAATPSAIAQIKKGE
jgi:uncharacterized lipoprotein YmbA